MSRGKREACRDGRLGAQTTVETGHGALASQESFTLPRPDPWLHVELSLTD